MFVDVVRVASILDIRRTRSLPFPGRVLVAEGDQVNPEDVIAEASLPGEVIALDIAQGLSISPDEVEACMVRGLGDEFEQGDIIAQFEGALSRLVRAPVGGRLADVTGGRAVITAGEVPLQVRAGMIGDVLEVIPELGVVLHARGSLLQGVWGNGKTGKGRLHWVESLESSDEPSIQISALEELEEGQLLAGGLCLHAAVLERAEEKKAAGLVVSALAPELIPLAIDLPVPVIVLGGFGALPTDQRIRELLRSKKDAMACVNASGVDMFEAQRPELIIPVDERMTGETLGYQAVVEVGRIVRVLSGEHAGRTGEIMECPESPVRFESGLVCPVAVIQLGDEESAAIPMKNLVIID